jgi:hypothetical protein
VHSHLSSFDGIPAVSAFEAARHYVSIAICMLLSGDANGVRGWAATKPAWADLSAKPRTTGSISNDWLHARLFAWPISLVISVIVGLCACLLTKEGAARTDAATMSRFTLGSHQPDQFITRKANVVLLNDMVLCRL